MIFLLLKTRLWRVQFRMVEINQEVPPDLYKAVAEILIFVYNLKKKTPNFTPLQQNNAMPQNPQNTPQIQNPSQSSNTINTLNDGSNLQKP